MTLRHPYRRGDVILLTVPFSDAAGSKYRPAVVLSTDDYHDAWDELLIAGLTSRSPKTARASDYGLRDWKQAGLSQLSWVRSHLATVHRQIVVRKLGQLSPTDLQGMEQSLRVATGL